MIPSMWVDKAPYHDRRYDPVWAAAAETGMPVVTHSGAAPRHEYGDHLGIYVSEVTWWPARPLWFLLWSGVFERHPGLRFGVAESGLLVAAEPAVVHGPALPRRARRQEARRRSPS